MKNLVVGDPHATAADLEDCERLMELVLRTAQEHKVQIVTFLGDLYDTHNIMDVRVMDFWRRWFKALKGTPATGIPETCVILGNHDQVTPTQRFPHALMAHPEVVVVDGLKQGLYYENSGVAAVPYCHDLAEFESWINTLAAKNPHTLICHQTFEGARYENGFPAKDGFPIDKIPACYKVVISGHIHTPAKIGNRVVYVGAPRWRTRSDVNIDRYLWILEHDKEKTKPLARIPTGPWCRRLWAYDDRPDAPVDPVGYSRDKDKLWVDVYGPDESYVRDRVAAVVAQYGAVTRSFPEQVKRSAVTESDGSAKAFKKFFGAFRPPHGTSEATLGKMVEERLAQ